MMVFPEWVNFERAAREYLAVLEDNIGGCALYVIAETGEFYADGANEDQRNKLRASNIWFVCDIERDDYTRKMQYDNEDDCKKLAHDIYDYWRENVRNSYY